GECSHRGRCSYRGPPLVGAPVAGAIWGGAFGRAGHAVRTGGGPAIRRCSYRGGVAFWVCRSTRDGCDMGWRIWACWARRSHRGRCSYRGGALVGAPAPGAKGSASLLILARVFRWPPSLLHPTPPRLSSFLSSR